MELVSGDEPQEVIPPKQERLITPVALDRNRTMMDELNGDCWASSNSLALSPRRIQTRSHERLALISLEVAETLGRTRSRRRARFSSLRQGHYPHG